jgi:hypothetical protein
VSFRFDIVARSGVLVSGVNADFLTCIAIARQQKRRVQSYLPDSRLRVHLSYPNGRRVPTPDIKSALRALADSSVQSMVSTRLAASALRSGAVAAEGGSAVDLDLGFSQAGVVAPPDSPDLGNPTTVREVE